MAKLYVNGEQLLAKLYVFDGELTSLTGDSRRNQERIIVVVQRSNYVLKPWSGIVN